jgi:hypothetical protein
MSAFGGPNIIDDGLVLYLDAGNRKSYPGSGTTWFDKSGRGNNGTLTNGPTFNTGELGSVVFDGVDDYSTIPSSSYWSIGANGTLSMWCYFTGNITTNHRFWCVNNNQNNIDAYLEAGTGLVGFHGGVTLTTTLLPRDQWVNLTVTYIGGVIAAYYNGVSQSLQGKTTDYNINQTGTLFIGQYAGGGPYYWRGKISTMSVYNRGLSAAEILQNYNATKGRFNL